MRPLSPEDLVFIRLRDDGRFEAVTDSGRVLFVHFGWDRVSDWVHARRRRWGLPSFVRDARLAEAIGRMG